MIRSLTLLFTLGLGACSVPAPLSAYSERWIALGEGEEGMAYLDRNSLRRGQEYTTALVREDIADDEEDIAAQESSLAINCGRRTLAGVSVTYRNRRGRVVEQMRIPRSEWEWRTVEPASFDERVLEAVCAQR